MAANGGGRYIAFEAATDGGAEYASTSLVGMCRFIAYAAHGGGDDRFQSLGIDAFVNFGQGFGGYIAVYTLGSQCHRYLDATPARKAYLVGYEGMRKACIVKETTSPQAVDDGVGIGGGDLPCPQFCAQFAFATLAADTQLLEACQSFFRSDYFSGQRHTA